LCPKYRRRSVNQHRTAAGRWNRGGEVDVEFIKRVAHVLDKAVLRRAAHTDMWPLDASKTFRQISFTVSDSVLGAVAFRTRPNGR
jgi:hypothetical protein